MALARPRPARRLWKQQRVVKPERLDTPNVDQRLRRGVSARRVKAEIRWAGGPALLRLVPVDQSIPSPFEDSRAAPADAATGAERWRLDVGGITASPGVTGGIVYVSGRHGTISALGE